MIKKKYIIYIVLIFLIINFPLPYNISLPGGVINVGNRIDLNTKDLGELNMTYVKNIKATPITLIFAIISPNIDINNKNNKINKKQEFVDKIGLKSSINNAIIVAFKHSNKKIKINNSKIYVTNISDKANTSLEVGDRIINIDGNNILNKSDIENIIKKHKENDIINIKTINDNNQKNKNAKIFKHNNKLYIGINYEILNDINYDFKINFKNNESGPSGGLILALSIYSKINNINITNNKKIAGTGTIDQNGNVGKIGGVKYKLLGAVKNQMDIFLLPKENFKEAIYYKNKYNFDIDIYPISTFNDAINILKN